MRLDVLLNSKDFNKYTASAIKFWSKKKKRKFNRIDLFLYAGLFFLLLFYLLRNDLMLNWVDFLTGFIAGTLLLLMVLNEQKKILEPKENGFVFGPTVYEFNHEGIGIKKEKTNHLLDGILSKKFSMQRNIFTFLLITI